MKIFWQMIVRMLHIFFIWTVIAFLVLMIPMQLFCHLLGNPEALKGTMSVFLHLSLFVYGFLRVFRFHPVFNKVYLMHLTLSPWQIGKPLPRGPVQLFWADGVIVGFFMLLSYFFSIEYLLVLPFIFLFGYNVGLYMSFCATGNIKYVIAYSVLAPLIVYPHLNGIVSGFVLLLITGIGHHGIRCYLKAFPWDTTWWTGNQVDMLKRQAIRRRVIQWPFFDLRTPSLFSGGAAVSMTIAALAFWYIHTIGWFIYTVDDSRIDGLFYGLVIFAIIFLRQFSYIVKYHPPISFFGRICTGRLIIPGYDIVYIGPGVVLLTGIFLPSLLRMIGVPTYVAYEVSISMCIFLGLAIPPSFETWVYTGHNRIALIPMKPVPTVKKSQANEVLANLFKK